MGNTLDVEGFEDSEELIEVFEREGLIKDLAEGVWTALEVAAVTSLAAFKLLGAKEKEESDDRDPETQETDLKKSDEFSLQD